MIRPLSHLKHYCNKSSGFDEALKSGSWEPRVNCTSKPIQVKSHHSSFFAVNRSPPPSLPPIPPSLPHPSPPAPYPSLLRSLTWDCVCPSCRQNRNTKQKNEGDRNRQWEREREKERAHLYKTQREQERESKRMRERERERERECVCVCMNKHVNVFSYW